MNKLLFVMIERSNNVLVVLILLGFTDFRKTVIHNVKEILIWGQKKYYKAVIAAQGAQQ